MQPHGLQALFALRLEKGHVIVGMDTEMDSTPRRLEHGLGGEAWTSRVHRSGVAAAHRPILDDRRRLFGFTMEGAAPIEGAPIWVGRRRSSGT